MHGLRTLAFLNDRAHAQAILNRYDPGHTLLRQEEKAPEPLDVAIVHRDGEVWFMPRTERGHILADALFMGARRDGNFFILQGAEATAAVEAIYLDRDAKAIGL